VIHTTYIPVSDIITDAAQELMDEDFGRLGRPFYRSAAQRGVAKMYKEVFGDVRYWSGDIPSNGIVVLPSGISGLGGLWGYTGTNCDVNSSTPITIKPNMHRLGGKGYIANNTWLNDDALQFSFGATRDPHHLCYAGFVKNGNQGELHLSDTCKRFDKVHVMYYGIGVDCFGEDFDVPEWMREAITDFVVHRAALRLEREDPQFLSRKIDRKENELKGNGGSWKEAKFIFLRMDPKTRFDTVAMMYRYGYSG